MILVFNFYIMEKVVVCLALFWVTFVYVTVAQIGVPSDGDGVCITNGPESDWGCCVAESENGTVSYWCRRSFYVTNCSGPVD